ncbi:uncharacterized protein LOC141631867 [Silene latifolia]|uniref:uncharacterized protein LOC141631867 n=1 Tax=Silene latifolia TaxID=37657 RepID=UPI003D779A44
MVKQELAAGYSQGKWNMQPVGYMPAGCYEWLRGSRPKVDCRLLGFGMDVDGSCYLCGLADETQQHLFFECEFSRQILQLVSLSAGFRIPDSNVLDWCIHNSGSKVQRSVLNAIVMGTMYQIWQQRNKSRVEWVVKKPAIVA